MQQQNAGSISLEYGFELTEDEMYHRLFGSTNPEKIQRQAQDDRKLLAMRRSKQNENQQPFASFDCPECVEMAILKLEDEIKLHMHKMPQKRKVKGTGHLAKA